MSKKLQLTIPTPCHENWDAMTPVEKGKFCGSCQKQVVDFSSMSDRQVAEFFKKPSTGSVCGRFMTDQLDREIEIPRKRIPWVKFFFQIALPALLVSLKTSAAKTQGEIKVRTATKDTTRRPVYDDLKVLGMVSRPMNIKPFMGDTIVTPVIDPLITIKGEIEPVCSEELIGKISPLLLVTKIDTLKIKGRVVDEKGDPVPYATIVIKGTRTGVITDLNGEFSIRPGYKWEKITLVSSSLGFETTEIVIDRSNYTGTVIIIEPVKLNYAMMGAM